MKSIDWQMVLFIGASTVHDWWIYWGLPRVYYYEVKKEAYSKIESDDQYNKKIA
ncbi:hypothetical protein [Ornithinibacillus contaminans]|uniref:hypothetical protein n=1 Tax=Ornithinibacillus contaminans TaxID=694055 RepID=UPI0014704E78|nr:hypothetical protein [Ornithinibacillus contaminans]